MFIQHIMSACGVFIILFTLAILGWFCAQTHDVEDFLGDENGASTKNMSEASQIVKRFVDEVVDDVIPQTFGDTLSPAMTPVPLLEVDIVENGTIFADCKDVMQFECDNHHATHNAPSWTCDICREKEQANISQEHEIRALQTKLMVLETENESLKRTTFSFLDEFAATTKRQCELEQSLTTSVFDTQRLRQKLKDLTNRLAETASICDDLTEKNDVLLQHNAQAAECSRHYKSEMEEATTRVEKMQFELDTLQHQNRKQSDYIQLLVMRCEKEKQARRDQLDWNLEDIKAATRMI